MASKFSCVQKSVDNKSVFYFSAEIGLTSSIPTYSGGLGVLAGDHIKAGADEEIPIIGMTLLYRHGQGIQRIDKNVLIIDIRSKKEWDETGLIKNSKKITAFDQEGNFLSSFLKTINKISNPSSEIIFISKTGDISSILANGFVEQIGYKNISSLEGGIEGWIKSGYSTY